MKLLLTTVGAAIAAIAIAFGSFGSAPQAEAAKPTTAVGVPVAGDIVGGGTFAGTFEINRIVNQGGELIAQGTLTGTLTDATGVVIGTVTDLPISVPVAATGSCEILDLVLGPLDLDLLGLVVHLDQVHLNITAEQGPGNLLGNLLCAVAGLLDTQASGNALARLLNQILGILG